MQTTIETPAKRPSSPRKIAAARANGAKSNGPITLDGKARSSLNALRHGLAAASLVLTIEDRPQFDQLYASYVHRFQPADDVEIDLVEEMIGCKWRMRRSIVVETQAIDLQMSEQREELETKFEGISAPAQLAIAVDRLTTRSTSLQNLQRYETRLGRQYLRAYKMLLDLRNNVPLPPPPPEPPPQPQNVQNEPNPTNGHQHAPQTTTHPSGLTTDNRQLTTLSDNMLKFPTPPACPHATSNNKILISY
jgi:hypothetical protein